MKTMLLLAAVRFRNAESLYVYNEVNLPLGPFHSTSLAQGAGTGTAR